MPQKLWFLRHSGNQPIILGGAEANFKVLLILGLKWILKVSVSLKYFNAPHPNCCLCQYQRAKAH